MIFSTVESAKKFVSYSAGVPNAEFMEDARLLEVPVDMSCMDIPHSQVFLDEVRRHGFRFKNKAGTEVGLVVVEAADGCLVWGIDLESRQSFRY